jgi:hypothetical protein
MLMVSTCIITPSLSQNNSPTGAVNVIDFYLDSAREKERFEIIRLAQTNDKKSTELLQGYVCEAMSAHY